MNLSGRAWVYGLLTFATICWGGNAVFGQLVVGEVSPMLVVTLRWTGALMLLMLFGYKKTLREWPVLREHLLYLSLMGALGFAFFNALFYVAAHSTTALNVGIIQGAMPIFVLLGAFAFYRTAVTKMQALGVAFAMMGVCAVVSGGVFERLLTLDFNLGDLMMLLASMLYAGFTVGLRRAPVVSSFSLFTVMAGAAFFASIPLTLLEYSQGNLLWPTKQGWIVVGLITIFPSLLSQLCFIKGVSIIGPGRAGIFVNMVPVFGAFFAVVILGEEFRSYHAIALILVLFGIALSEIAKNKFG